MDSIIWVELNNYFEKLRTEFIAMLLQHLLLVARQVPEDSLDDFCCLFNAFDHVEDWHNEAVVRPQAG